MIDKIKRIFAKILDFLFDLLPQGSLILVAGKDANNHRIYESIITGAGHRYTGRYILDRGFNLTFLETPRLIIWDLNTNETASDSVLYSIEIHCNVPVLIFTDDKDGMSADRAIQSHPKGYRNAVRIKKPVTTEQLIALISAYLYEKTSPLIKETSDRL